MATLSCKSGFIQEILNLTNIRLYNQEINLIYDTNMTK